MMSHPPSPIEGLRRVFATPPPASRPWVYWYFMEGNMTEKGIDDDLASMKAAGIGGAIMLEVNIGVPIGPVRYMSPEWRRLVGHAVKEADRLGLEIALGTGPGWCGTGGPWVRPEDAMQHLVSSTIDVQGPKLFEGQLPRPKPRTPYFGLDTLNPELRKEWEEFYQDEIVLAFPTPEGNEAVRNLDEKALVYRAPYSSTPGVKPFLDFDRRSVPEERVVRSDKVIDLTDRTNADGSLRWDVPPGKWTIARFGRTLTGQTSRPAPQAGLGFESDKFESAAIERHLDAFVDAIVKETGPNIHPGRGLTALHFDSWEMGSQNWSAHFREEFRRRRGYDAARFLPVMAGRIVDSTEISERFLWDLRQTAQELVIERHLGTIRARGAKYGLGLDVEPYDMNPTSDLDLGATATVPMAEFWSKGLGYDTEYSVDEAVSVAHTQGRPVIAAESFTADDRDTWLQHPASMKAQTDWAIATGINRIAFHRYQHQPEPGVFPGMTMGPYGVHWERTQTWWDMVGAYHAYIARCQALMREGLPVADILYLTPEGAPNVFQPPADAKVGRLPDRRGYNFDACSPKTLIERASAKNGRICFPDGMSYRVLVLPRVDAMTPELLRKVSQLCDGGVTVVGRLPRQSPSLARYPECDDEVAKLSASLANRVVRDTEESPEPVSLEGASWIWSGVEDARSSAPIGDRTLRRSFALPKGRSVQSARVAATADNSFRLTLNGKQVAEGHNFHQIRQADVAGALVEGTNELVVKVTNEGSSPNPAGVILRLVIRFRDGGRMEVVTDGGWAGAKALGPWTVSPWNLTAEDLPRPERYPSYESTASLLRRTLPPDVSSGEALRYGHRHIGELDVYFVGNRLDRPFDGLATFRAVGRAEWWDPMNGATRPLPQSESKDGTTAVPLILPAGGSGFVVFDRAAKSLARGLNFPSRTPVGTLAGPWEVSFESRFGGLPEVRFNRLEDWSKRSEPEIRDYSGKAVYRTTFDGKSATTLSLGDVRNIASVRLNGKDLGVVWCAPWEVVIPAGTLKARGNVLEITVANLWANRLIGDAGLPPEKRVTRTTWSPFRSDSPHQPSGLLGPVVLLQSTGT